MKRILVPIDFSKLSENTLVFTNKLASRLGADIILLHCTQLPVADNQTLSLLRGQLCSFAERLRYHSTVRQQARRIRYEFEVHQGCLQQQVERLANKVPIDMVVMPLEYADCEPAEFPGSHAANLAEVLTCPVMLVPENGQLRNIRSLVFATDYTDQDPDVLQQIAGFSRTFQAHLSVVQVYSTEERRQLPSLKQGMKELERTMNYRSLSCHLKEEDDMLEGISEFAESHAADMLILATQDSYLTRNLFDIRYTKTGAYHTQVPILTYHQHKRKPCSGCCAKCASQQQQLNDSVATEIQLTDLTT